MVNPRFEKGLKKNDLKRKKIMSDYHKNSVIIYLYMYTQFTKQLHVYTCTYLQNLEKMTAAMILQGQSTKWKLSNWK